MPTNELPETHRMLAINTVVSPNYSSHICKRPKFPLVARAYREMLQNKTLVTGNSDGSNIHTHRTIDTTLQQSDGSEYHKKRSVSLGIPRRQILQDTNQYLPSLSGPMPADASVKILHSSPKPMRSAFLNRRLCFPMLSREGDSIASATKNTSKFIPGHSSYEFPSSPMQASPHAALPPTLLTIAHPSDSQRALARYRLRKRLLTVNGNDARMTKLLELASGQDLTTVNDEGDAILSLLGSNISSTLVANPFVTKNAFVGSDIKLPKLSQASFKANSTKATGNTTTSLTLSKDYSCSGSNAPDNTLPREGRRARTTGTARHGEQDTNYVFPGVF